MIEKPPIADELIGERLRAEYGLHAVHVEFLPLGVDVNSAVYRVEAPGGGEYFLKLRNGPFKESSVTVPRFLSAAGVPMIIGPLPTLGGAGWGFLGSYEMILYPYVRGRDGYARKLSQIQWRHFGASLAAIHAAQPTTELRASLPREEFSDRARKELRSFQSLVQTRSFAEPIAADMAAFILQQMEVIHEVCGRAEDLAKILRRRRLDMVLCHSDLHPGNFLVADDDGVFIVDWDEALLAPRERDLMFIGATGNPTGQEEIGAFYQGYGEVSLDHDLLAHYRYERIVQDLAAFCAQILSTDQGGMDRAQGLEYFKSNFVPGGEIDIARQTDRRAAR